MFSNCRQATPDGGRADDHRRGRVGCVGHVNGAVGRVRGATARTVRVGTVFVQHASARRKHVTRNDDVGRVEQRDDKLVRVQRAARGKSSYYSYALFSTASKYLSIRGLHLFSKYLSIYDEDGIEI